MVSDTHFVYGAERLGQRLRTIRAAATGLLTGNEIPDLLLARTQSRFQQQVDPDGVPWAGWMPSTVKRIKGKAHTGKILQESGALYAALQIIRGSNQGILASATGAGVRIGIIGPEKLQIRARVHQFGNNHVVQRRFLGVSRLDVKAVDSLMRRAMLAATL